VSQGEDPELKPQYCEKKKKRRRKIASIIVDNSYLLDTSRARHYAWGFYW
jgi:hypothetical protein